MTEPARFTNLHKEERVMAKVAQSEIDAVCEDLEAISKKFRRARELAFELAKEGDPRINQVIGAFCGIVEYSKVTDGLLRGLAEVCRGN